MNTYQNTNNPFRLNASARDNGDSCWLHIISHLSRVLRWFLWAAG